MNISLKLQCKQGSKSLGFTLIELLISLLLMSIVLTLSLPSLKSFFIAQQISYYTQDLASLIELAREQALALGGDIVLCSSHDGVHCDSSTSQRRWDGVLLLRNSTEVLKRSGPISSSYQLYWFGGFNPSSALHFEATGFAEAEQGSFYFCPPAAYLRLAVALIVLKSGRLRVSHDYSKLAGICS